MVLAWVWNMGFTYGGWWVERNGRDWVGFNYISGLVMIGDVDCVGPLEDGANEGWWWGGGGQYEVLGYFILGNRNKRSQI